MFSRRRVFGIAALVALALVCFAYVSAQTVRKKNTVQVVGQPPTLSLSADTNTIIVCPRDTTATTQVHLNAAATSPEGHPLVYKWTATGGRIVGDGANTTWDLSGAAPGTYTAQVEVTTNGTDCICRAFKSIPVAVAECASLPNVCPNISITCPETVAAGQPLTFSADMSGGTPNVTPNIEWTVSSGRIISGQATSSIQVDTTGLGGQDVRATIAVNGYTGLNCSASCMTQIPAIIKPKKFDEFPSIALNDEKARLDNFAIQIQNEPNSQGYIIVYGGRPSEAQRHAVRARGYLINTRGIDASRIVAQQGSGGGSLRIEFWIVPRGAEPPPLR